MRENLKSSKETKNKGAPIKFSMISQEKLSRPEEVGMIFKGLPGEGNGNPLQYSCLENPTDREAWQVTVHGVTRVRHDLTTIGRKIQRAKGKKEKKKKTP